MARARQAAAVQAGQARDGSELGRWEPSARIEVAPHNRDDLEAVWEDAGTERYPADWTAAQIAAAFLRSMADEIEGGVLPEAPPTSSA